MEFLITRMFSIDGSDRNPGPISVLHYVMKRISSYLAILALWAGAYAHAAKPDPLTTAQQVDALLAKDWATNHLKANPPANEETMVRRLYLDIVGRIPTVRETEAYLQSTDAKKREHLIDQLLSGEGYVQHYFNFWADVLRAQTRPQAGGISGVAYLNFIKDSLRTNKPYDQFVRDMISATGKVWENGAIGYYTRDRNMPLDNMATTVRIFLGTRIECAQCHNHPFDKWTQRQFYEMAAFTYGVSSNDYNSGSLQGARTLMNQEQVALQKKLRGPDGKTDPSVQEQMEQMRKDNRHVSEAMTRARDPLRYTAVDYKTRKLQLPHDYKYPDAKPNALVTATTMMGKAVNCPPGGNTLEAYAEWMTSPDNERFTSVVVNRLWKKAFGLALIEPLDELMDNSEPMNPELLKYLEKYMVDSGYDMKAFVKMVFNTKAYQAQVTREEVPAGVVYHFTGPLLRRMSAEQMWDSFVALINATPDMPNVAGRKLDDQRILGIKKLSDALDSLTPEEMLRGARAAGEKYKEQATRLKELQGQITEARANDDKEKVRELQKESSELQRNALKSVNSSIVVPAVLKLAATVNGKQSAEGASKDGAPAAAGSDSMMMLGGDVESNMSKIAIPGYDAPAKTPEEIATEREAKQKVFLDEANYFAIPAKQQKAYLNYRDSQMRTWLRAAEIESPAPRGHYLREFGQSDRELVENGNLDASVPQALAMMNGTLLPEIMGAYSQLTLAISRAKYPDEQVDTIYTALLSRKPTPKEKEAWLHAQDKGLTDTKDLIYALLNTQQFIFIQ